MQLVFICRFCVDEFLFINKSYRVGEKAWWLRDHAALGVRHSKSLGVSDSMLRLQQGRDTGDF